jgi:hypothetical protein
LILAVCVTLAVQIPLWLRLLATRLG